ncbi:MAG: sporulation integral membrane protein YtvI [Clostridia bacterium]|nr:sporulation integral membrane protein YtvI [Clostridia bacterium]
MEKKKSFLISAVYYLTIAAIIFLIFKYAIFIVMPFLIGFAIAAILNPTVRFFCGKFDMKRRPTALLILLIFYATIGMLATILVVRLAVMIGDFSGRLPSLYADTIEPALVKGFEFINRLLSRFDGPEESDFAETLAGIFNSIKNSLGGAVSDISVRALAWLSGFAASIPKFVIELLFAVISSFFFIVDYEKLISLAKSRLPRRAVGIMTDLRDRFFSTVIKYIRSYALIMLITFAELFLGLIIIGTENAVMYALIISLLDVLPVVGTGAVMIPWALVELIRGHVGYAVGLLAIWGVITVVRNIIEPRIVGKEVGLHPLLTLAAMFVGSKLLGFIGLILLPIGLSIIMSVLRERDQSSSGM